MFCCICISGLIFFINFKEFFNGEFFLFLFFIVILIVFKNIYEYFLNMEFCNFSLVGIWENDSNYCV